CSDLKGSSIKLRHALHASNFHPISRGKTMSISGHNAWSGLCYISYGFSGLQHIPTILKKSNIAISKKKNVGGGYICRIPKPNKLRRLVVMLHVVHKSRAGPGAQAAPIIHEVVACKGDAEIVLFEVRPAIQRWGDLPGNECVLDKIIRHLHHPSPGSAVQTERRIADNWWSSHIPER